MIAGKSASRGNKLSKETYLRRLPINGTGLVRRHLAGGHLVGFKVYYW
jgi:hypothetical protein